MNWANTRMSEMVFAVAAVLAMAACGPGSQEHGHFGAHDSTSEPRNVIPPTAAAILEQADHFSVQLQSNSRGWLHRTFPRKRHQMRYLVDFADLLAKQVLSQLSYTPQTTI